MHALASGIRISAVERHHSEAEFVEQVEALQHELRRCHGSRQSQRRSDR
jgi:hypothetical protein